MLEAEVQITQAGLARTISLSEKLIASGYSPLRSKDQTYLLGHFQNEGAYVITAGVRFKPTISERLRLWRSGVPLGAGMLTLSATPDPDSDLVEGEIYFWPKGNNTKTGKTIPLSDMPNAAGLVTRLNKDLSVILVEQSSEE